MPSPQSVALIEVTPFSVAKLGQFMPQVFFSSVVKEKAGVQGANSHSALDTKIQSTVIEGKTSAHIVFTVYDQRKH